MALRGRPRSSQWWSGKQVTGGGGTEPPPPEDVAAAVAEAVRVDPETAAFYRKQKGMIEAALRTAGYDEQSFPNVHEESYLDKVLMLIDDETRERFERIEEKVQAAGEPTRRELGDFGEGDTDVGDLAPPDRDRRTWTGTQNRPTADKHYYAIHFEGKVSAPLARKLLNKFQDAERIIHWAKTQPDRLTRIRGVGQRTVEKLAALDPDEAIKTPRERGTSEDRLREEGIGAEGEGLTRFEDEDVDESEDLYETLRELGVPGNGARALDRRYDVWAEVEAAPLADVFGVSGVGQVAMEALVPDRFDFRSTSLTVGEVRARAGDEQAMDSEPAPTEPFAVGDRVQHDDGRTGTVTGMTAQAVTVEYDESGERKITSPSVLTVVAAADDEGPVADEADTLTLRDTEGTVVLQVERGDAVRVDFYNTISKAEDTVRGVITRIRPGEPDRIELTNDVRLTGVHESADIYIGGRRRGTIRTVHKLFGNGDADTTNDDDGTWSLDDLAAAIENVAAAGDPTVTERPTYATIDWQLPVAADAPFSSSLEYDPDAGTIEGVALRFSPTLLERYTDDRLRELFDGLLDATDPPSGTIWGSYPEGDAPETGPHILAPSDVATIDPDEFIPWLDRLLDEYRRVFE